MTLQHFIRRVMLSAKESIVLKEWLTNQASPHTRSCYERDANWLLAHVGKSLSRVTLGDLQSFDDALVATGLAPVASTDAGRREEPVRVLLPDAVSQNESGSRAGIAGLREAPGRADR